MTQAGPTDTSPPRDSHGREGLVDPSLAELFMGFLSVALTAFGGVLPIARRMIVDRRRWLSPDEFTELLSLCQFLPGPNIGNLSIAVGARFHGLLGSAAAAAGLMAAPCVIVLVMAGFYERFAHLTIIQHLFLGVAAAACGMVFAMAAKIAVGVLKRRMDHGILFIVLAFVSVGVLRLPILPVLVILLPLSVAAYTKTAWTGLSWGRRSSPGARR